MTSGAGGTGDAASVDLGAATSARRFLEMSIDLMAVLTLDTTILEASESWKRTLGWAPAEVVGRPLLELFHADDVARVEDELLGILGGGEAVAVVVRVRKASGDFCWVQGNARADLDAERIYVTAADISERMALEEALRRQLELEELVASIAARLIGAEPGVVPAEIERAIGELASVLGAHRAHFLRGRRHPDDTTYVEWLHPELGQRTHTPAPERDVQRWWRQTLVEGRLLHLADVEELRSEAPEVVDSMRADGVRSLLHVPLPPHDGYWGFLTLASIEEVVPFSEAASALLRLAGDCFMSALAQGDAAAALLDARRELEHRNEELERSNEDLERFAYAAAHDLKAPLVPLEMALSAATSVEGPTGELLNVARRGASRMRQLIEDLLAFSAVGQATGSTQPVDLDEVLDEVLADHERLIADTGTTIERSALPTVPGHRMLLGQLLQNLLANAFKFAKPDELPRVAISSQTDAEGVTVTVADNGIGVPAERRSDVFGIFTRLNATDQYPGSGIGLATCAKVVAHHDGRIWLGDGIDGGVAVHFWLPHRPAGTAAAVEV